MQVGVIADTHDNVAAVEAAVETFEQRGIDVLIHCGDYVAPPVVPYFEGFELHGVLGNNDGDVDALDRTFRSVGGTLHGRFADLTFDDTRFAVLHGEDRDEVDRLAASGKYDVVCYGHHHAAERGKIDGTTILNPGAHFPTVPADHRSVAVVDAETGDVEVVAVG
ncbi:MAG: metallophosphoesterase [Halobacteriales archaeon]